MVITRFVEVYKIKIENILNKILHNLGINTNMHKKVKKHIDILLKAYYNGFKQIVERFKNLAEFGDGFNN